MEQVDIEKGREWYREHKQYVDNIMTPYVDVIYAPSAEDISKPELWKAAHWKWFFLYHYEEKIRAEE